MIPQRAHHLCQCAPQPVRPYGGGCLARAAEAPPRDVRGNGDTAMRRSTGVHNSALSERRCQSAYVQLPSPVCKFTQNASVADALLVQHVLWTVGMLHRTAYPRNLALPRKSFRLHSSDLLM